MVEVCAYLTDRVHDADFRTAILSGTSVLGILVECPPFVKEMVLNS